MDNDYMQFDSSWWSHFRTKWDEGDESKAEFAGIGTIRIQICDVPENSVCITWDSMGMISAIESSLEPLEGTPTFSGDTTSWVDFIFRGIPAGSLLVEQRLRYVGPMYVLLRWGSAFQLMATVGKKVGPL